MPETEHYGLKWIGNVNPWTIPVGMRFFLLAEPRSDKCIIREFAEARNIPEDRIRVYPSQEDSMRAVYIKV